MSDRTPIPGLPKQQEWTVLAVREGKEEPNPNGGMLKKHYVDFEGARDVYWRRKMPATVEVGQSYFGTISEGTYGPMFKKESPDQAAAPQSSGGSSGGRAWIPESEKDPERSARILRQHSQEMALRVYAKAGFEGQDLHAYLRAWTDWFDDDVNRVGEAARTKTPEAPELPDLSEVETALSASGLTPQAAVAKVAAYMLTDLEPERAAEAYKRLNDPAGAAKARDALVKLTEAALGEPLPTGEDPGAEYGNDAPF